MQLRTSYEDLRDWIDHSLEAFRLELRTVLFPFFVHCYLELVEGSELEEAATLLRESGEEHMLAHPAEVNLLSLVTAPAHVTSHEFSRRIRDRRFEVALCAHSRDLLTNYLQHRGRTALLTILNDRLTLRVPRLTLPPAPPGGSNGVASAQAAEAAAIATSQLWQGLDEEKLREANQSVEDWSPPAALAKKHADLAESLGITLPEQPVTTLLFKPRSLLHHPPLQPLLFCQPHPASAAF